MTTFHQVTVKARDLKIGDRNRNWEITSIVQHGESVYVKWSSVPRADSYSDTYSPSDDIFINRGA